MRRTIEISTIALLSFVFGFRCCDIYYVNKESNKHKNKNIEKIKQSSNFQEIVDYEDIDKIFYTSLQNCDSLSVIAKPGHIGYIIEGVVDDKCLFKKLEIDFMDTICNLPMEMTEKYAEEGLNITRQIDELRAQNKSGFVDASSYINDINNDKTYCRYEYYQRKK